MAYDIHTVVTLTLGENAAQSGGIKHLTAMPELLDTEALTNMVKMPNSQ